ncbi:MAG: M23 family metallopeptidase, partial [Bacteroidia bacterium]|nr:M23 family metallopeptidase [Bacteroidia bacterium]
FFLLPTRQSYLLVILVAPVTAIFITAGMNIMSLLQLPQYSLPFDLTVLLVLYALRYRIHANGLILVTEQQFSPEKNLYQFLHKQERYRNDIYFPIRLPFFGNWTVSQGHNGKITHKPPFHFAWDFVVTDDNNQTWKPPAADVSDFYCYNLPVLAPASGWVIEIVDGIADNEVGDIDVKKNWGNTIILKHAEGLYSQLSHLKSGSFKVKVGDWVTVGDIIATCGSSGRSPEPHLHFQLQQSPFVGSLTLYYPIAYYIVQSKQETYFRSFEIPKEGEILGNVKTTWLLSHAFEWLPGTILAWSVEYPNGKRESITWQAFVNAWNIPYLYCHKTKSYAYFVNNGTVHYFTEFYGDKTSLLYQFYLLLNKVLLGYYQNLVITDSLPTDGFYDGVITWLQDFIAPITPSLKASYHL